MTQDAYQTPGGAWIVRREEVGREGGEPPILLTFWHAHETPRKREPVIGDSLRWVGTYSRPSMDMEPVASGPFFK